MIISIRIIFTYFLFALTFLTLKKSQAAPDKKNNWPEMVSSFEIFEDSLDLPIDSVKIPDAKFFQDYNGQQLNRNKVYWLMIVIDNAVTRQQNYFIHFNSLLSNVKLYQKDENGNYTEKIGGTLIPEKQRSVGGMLKEKVPFTISRQNKTEFFVRICTQVELVYNLSGMEIVSSEEYSNWVDNTYFIQFFFLGVIVVLLILSLSLYILTQKRLYLFYFFYIFSTTLFFVNHHQISERYLLYNFPKIDLFLSFTLTIGEAIYLWFFYEALKNEAIPEWRGFICKSAIVFTIVCSLICIIVPFDYYSANFINDIYGLFTGGFVVTIFFLLYRKVSKPIKIIITGSLIMVTTGLIAIVLDFSKVVSSNMNLYQAGVLIEVILFSIALNHIYNKERLEKVKVLLVNSQLAVQQVNTDLENHILADKLAMRNRELATKTILIEQKETIIYEAVAYLAQLSEQNTERGQEIQSMIKSLQLHRNNDNWKEFELHFRKINPRFYSELIEECPNLTGNDMKLCAFIKLNLSTKQIASITGKSQNTIDVSRSRLRKKLGLKNGNLTSFITAIG